MKKTTKFFYCKYFLLLLTVLPVLLLLNQTASACSVPVFRYALERWKPDAYKGIFIYRGEISKQDQALLDHLKEAASTDSPLNLIIKPVNVDTFSKEKLDELMKGPIPDDLPLLLIWYPEQMGKSHPFLQEKLTFSLVDNLVQSPERKELAESLINGESVIWVFIPSGNKTKDEGALGLIRQELGSALQKFTKNPFTILDGGTRKRLSYSFPVMTLSRDNEAERIFIETLMKSESDLYEYTNEPMVFPVFGRGRVLGCLFGEYITPQRIQEAVIFLSGACSCEIKNLNPGVDLLVSAPWDIVVMNSFIQDDAVPELTGVLSAFDDAKVPVSSLGEESAPERSKIPGNDRSLLTIFGVTIAGVVLLVVFLSVVISRRRKG